MGGEYEYGEQEYGDQLDQFNIATPEQVDLRFPIAGVGSRFLAILLDQTIQSVVFLVIVLVIYAASPKDIQTRVGEADPVLDTGAKWVIAAFVLILFLMNWGYFVLFEAFWHGQTPGKRAMKLRVLKDSGRSITLFESMTRNLVRVVDSLPSMYVVGLITMLCNRQHKRLGDLAAGTIVVHERMENQPAMAYTSRTFTDSRQAEPAGLMPGAREEWAANESALPADAVARLRPEDLHTIELFFSRALDLPPVRREELAERVAGTMCGKMGIVRPGGMRAEQMLEMVAYKMRGVGR